MKKHIIRFVGLALLVGGPLLGQVPVYGDAAATGATASGEPCCGCCPHCGCRLVAVCNICCTTKKVTEYKYRCTSQDKCIPGVTPVCKRHDCCENDCGGRCTVKEINKLVKVPVTKEVPVRTCVVEWVCPRCSDGGAAPAPAAVPAAPIPPAPAPMPKLPPRPKTTDSAPLPTDIGSLRIK